MDQVETCRLKATRFSLPVLHFSCRDPATLAEFIRGQMQRARALLQDAPILLAPERNLDGLDEATLLALVECCRAEGLYPVGLARVPAAEHWQRISRLRILHTTGAATSSNAPSRPQQNLWMDRPIRSGQQVMAGEGSLFLLASVSATAEVLARDDIHIQGTLKGKALAGIQGNEQARIFCRRFAAELVAIAGHYRLFDEPDPQLFGKPVCIRLQENQLRFQTLDMR